MTECLYSPDVQIHESVNEVAEPGKFVWMQSVPPRDEPLHLHQIRQVTDPLAPVTRMSPPTKNASDRGAKGARAA